MLDESNRFGLVWVYWTGKQKPREFSVAKQRTSKIVAKLFKDKVKFDSRGVGMNPTQAFDEVCELASVSDNFKLNPSLHPKNVRQAKWFKHTEKRAALGDNVFDYLFELPNVQFRNIQHGEKTEINFLLAHPYQLSLFTGLVETTKGILYVDTTFDLGGKFIVTTVMEHSMLANRATGGPALIQVMFFIFSNSVLMMQLTLHEDYARFHLSVNHYILLFS